MSAVVFDVDGVLVDLPHQRAWKEALAALACGDWRELVPTTGYRPEAFNTATYQQFAAGKPRLRGAQAILDPSDREKTQLFMQRYIQNFPAATGEIVIFDRSWYNRAGVEYVMGFCTEEEHKRFLKLCPEGEGYIVGAGIQLIKIWLEVNKDEQARRMAARIDDPLRQWKLSPMDVKSWGRWYEYSRARDIMLEATDTEASPWHILRSDDKRRARLNCISHILTLIPYKKIARSKVKLPKRTNKGKYDDEASLQGRRIIPAINTDGTARLVSRYSTAPEEKTN